MRIHYVYRAWAGANSAPRPNWYSKRAALGSFLAALDHDPDPGDVVFLWDGPCPDELRSLLASRGEIIELPNVGNARSYRSALGMLDTRPWADSDLVYLSEDDYLHVPGCFVRLKEAAQTVLWADYFTLYDHPDYAITAMHQRYRRRVRQASERVDDLTWSPALGATLTYAARIGRMRTVAPLHLLASRSSAPRDTVMWQATLGVGPFQLLSAHRDVLVADRQAASTRLKRLTRRADLKSHLMAVASPSLATHAHLPFLATGRDWTALASDGTAYMADH